MRFLFAAPPSAGHLLPLIPLAWAARASGHEVLFGTNGRGLEFCAQAGLATLELAPGSDVTAAFRERMGRPSGGPPPLAGADAMKAKSAAMRKLGAEMFARMNDEMADGLIDAAREWQADLVVYEPFLPIGLLAARLAGVPAVLHGLGITIGRGGPMEAGIAAGCAPTLARHGVTGGLGEPAASLDLCPPSMGATSGGWPMRYVPYNGGKVLPDWLITPPARPRICVTLGSVVPHLAGVGLLGGVIAAAGQLEAEVVLALGDVDVSALGALPDNVRVAGWMPLAFLAPTCAAIVHHGGSGTTMSALAAGVPQLVLPRMADQPFNAEAVAKRGMGLTLTPDALSEATAREAIARLLTEAAFMRAGREVAAEIVSMPAPSAVLERLLQLADRGAAPRRA